MSERIDYDELAYFQDNAAEAGLPWSGPPDVRRHEVDMGAGRWLSGLVWGEAPGIVLLHGGAQNAHTWDTVALALDRPLLALDLPAHGHSGPGKEGGFDLGDNARDVAAAVRALAVPPVHVVGMSLGGATALMLADVAPEVVRSLTLVDITPGVTAGKAGAITAFVNGPPKFDSFDDLLERTVAFNPTRSESSLRRGILHNAEQLEDGSWVWRWARHRPAGPITESGAAGESRGIDFTALWDVVGGLEVPLMLTRGLRPQSVVDDADEAELRRRAPQARVEHFAESGHSIQGDQPVELAATLASFFDGVG